jgi:hypothetical protein
LTVPGERIQSSAGYAQEQKDGRGRAINPA